MNAATRVRVGRARRHLLVALAVVMIVLVASSQALFASGHATTTGPTPLAAPSEPVNHLTLDVGHGAIATPYRAQGFCGGLNDCPAPLHYTTIAPGKTTIVLLDAPGAQVHVTLPHGVNRKLNARTTTSTSTVNLRAGKWMLTAVTRRHGAQHLVIWVTDNPYVTTLPTTRPTVTTLPADHYLVVSVDDNGIHANPASTPSGQTDVLFLDNRTNPVGAIQFDGIAAGNDIVTTLCPAVFHVDAVDGPTMQKWAINVVVTGSPAAGCPTS